MGVLDIFFFGRVKRTCSSECDQQISTCILYTWNNEASESGAVVFTFSSSSWH